MTEAEVISVASPAGSVGALQYSGGTVFAGSSWYVSTDAARMIGPSITDPGAVTLADSNHPQIVTSDIYHASSVLIQAGNHWINVVSGVGLNTSYAINAGGDVRCGGGYTFTVTGFGSVGLAYDSTQTFQISNRAGGYGALRTGWTDSGTNTIKPAVYVRRNSTGTPAAGLGASVSFELDSSTTAGRTAGMVDCYWTTATDATRAARMDIGTYDVYGGPYIGFSVAGNGTGGTLLSFYNGTPQLKPSVTGSKASNAALASLISALSSLGLVIDSTS